ncbi:retrovirus-related Pol polyprotein from transposon 297 [Trichonephila clavipes]|nr:retrovirus-related Pol polyprotein from transposon 297 [Trichonephila clavipes]
MPNEYDSNQISHVAVKSLPLFGNKPALWFVRYEAQSEVAKILNDTTKFNYVLSAVQSHILNSVIDLVLKPPENGKYKVFKKRLIDVHSGNEDSKIRTLLQGLELGNARPSQLLTLMRSLAGDSVGELRLPNGPQTILAALNENLDQLSTVADKINDLAFSQGINSVAAIAKKTVQLEQQIAQLTQQVSELTNFVKRSRSPARNSNHFTIALIREMVLKGTKNPQKILFLPYKCWQQSKKVGYSMLFSFGNLEWQSSPGLIEDRHMNPVL